MSKERVNCPRCGAEMVYRLGAYECRQCTPQLAQQAAPAAGSGSAAPGMAQAEAARQDRMRQLNAVIFMVLFLAFVLFRKNIVHSYAQQPGSAAPHLAKELIFGIFIGLVVIGGAWRWCQLLSSPRLRLATNGIVLALFITVAVVLGLSFLDYYPFAQLAVVALSWRLFLLGCVLTQLVNISMILRRGYQHPEPGGLHPAGQG